MALEFELFKSRLSGSVEYFDRRSSNLLFSIPQAPDTGTTSAYKNAGTMYNRGVEVDLNEESSRRRIGRGLWELTLHG